MAKRAKYIQCKGVSLYYRTSGNPKNPAIVLLHGITTSSAVWGCVQKALARLGFFTVAFDFPGHGYSSAPKNKEAYSFDSLAADTYCVIQSLKLVKPAIVGWSLGGLVAQLFATKYPHSLSKLGLVGTGPQGNATTNFPWAIPQDSAKKIEILLKKRRLTEFAEFIHSLNLTDQCPPQELAQLKKSLVEITLQSNPRSVLNSFMVNGSTSLISNLPKIAVPTLIFAGGRDHFYPLPAQEFMLNRIPDAYFVEAYGKGHSAFLTAKGLFNETLYRFLTGKYKECDVCTDITP